MLGSDYPLVLGEEHPGKMIESIDDMDAKIKVNGVGEHETNLKKLANDVLQETILAGNALEFLGLDQTL